MSEGKKGNGKTIRHFFRQCFVTLGVSMNIMGHGCIIGFSAILILALRQPSSPIHATVSQESWIASILGFALITGNIIITPLMDRLGRRKCHVLTTLPVLIGWFILLLVKTVPGLIAARFIQGIAMGMLGSLGSIIIAEMTDPSNRGAFLTSVSLSLTIGVLFCHTLGSFLTWQQCGLASSFVTFFSLILIIYSPDSPPWLIGQGRIEEAKEIFIWLRGDGEVQMDELEKMIKAQQMMRKSSVIDENLSVWVKTKRFMIYFRQTIRKPEFFKPIIIMICLYMMFQFAGINILASYATDIIHDVVGPDANAGVLMVALDIERLFGNILTVFLAKNLKRRTLLFTSGTICVSAYLAKAAYVYARQIDKLPFDNQWVPMLLLGIYLFSLTVGITSIPFALAGEIFPLEYRSMGSGISIILGLSMNFFLAVKSFPILKTNIGLPLTYCFYAGVVSMCMVVAWFMLPETKDKTLQEISDSFKGLSPADRKSSVPLKPEQEEMLRRCSSHILY